MLKKVILFSLFLFFMIFPMSVFALNEVNVYFVYSPTFNICSQEKAFLEAFDISQAAQGYMHLLLIIFGKHYCLDFNSLFNKAIKKNNDR